MGHIDKHPFAPSDECGFDARDVLSICTGLIPDPQRLPGIYKVLGYMTGAPVHVSEFETAMRECKTYLLYSHPELLALEPPHFRAIEDAVQWLEEESMRIGGVVTVRRH